MVDDDLKPKANPNIVLMLDYLAVGVLLGLLYYAGIIVHVIDPSNVTVAITGILASFGVYKATS